VRRDVALTRTASMRGRVAQADGAPVAGATVTVTDPHGGVVVVRRTGEDGSWETEEVEPGRYTVTVLAPGRAPQAARVEVREGGVRHDVEVPEARYGLTGAVRGTGGRPVPESLVVLVGQDGSVVASSVTGADGRFRFDDLAPGRHMLTASGFAPVSREVAVTASDAGSTDLTLTVVPPTPAERTAGRHEADGPRPTNGVHPPDEAARTVRVGD
jgi:protocatechuate 3,4-dioxygenase beta subunit